MARVLFSDVTALARKTIDDRDVGAGYVFPDSELYDFGTSIQRRIFRAMTNNGLEDANSFTTYNVAANTAHPYVDWSGSGDGTLPDDFLRPLKLWERTSTDPDSSYVDMSNTSERLPDEDSTYNIRYWVWEDSGANLTPAIKYIAPTSARVIRVLYQREAIKITSSSQPLYVPGSYDAMASGLVWLAAQSRGSDSTGSAKARFDQDMDELMRQARKGEQRRPRRRLPYGYMKTFRG